MRRLLTTVAVLAVLASPAAGRQSAPASQPTGKWCEHFDNVNNEAPDIWRDFKRGDCKPTEDSEDGWIVFTAEGYREASTVCKITKQRRGKNWLLYQCMVDGYSEDRLHKWSVDRGNLFWGTLEDEDQDDETETPNLTPPLRHGRK